MTFKNVVLIILFIFTMVGPLATPHSEEIHAENIGTSPVYHPIYWGKIYGEGYGYSVDIVKKEINGTTYYEGYIVAGISLKKHALWVLRLNVDGVVIWSKIYGENMGYKNAIVRFAGDGFIVATDYKGDILVLNLNLDGSVRWQKRFGGEREDWPEKIMVRNSSYLIMGETSSFGGNESIWLISLGKDGEMKEQEIIYSSGNCYGYDIYAAKDGYIIAGKFTNASGSWGLILKVNSNGMLLWENIYNLTELRGITGRIYMNQNTRYLAIGTKESYVGNEDIAVIGIADDGTVLWSRAYDISFSDRGYEIKKDYGDYDYNLFAYTNSENPTVLIRIEPDGSLRYWDISHKKPESYSYPCGATDGKFMGEIHLILEGTNILLVSTIVNKDTPQLCLFLLDSTHMEFSMYHYGKAKRVNVTSKIIKISGQNISLFTKKTWLKGVETHFVPQNCSFEQVIIFNSKEHQGIGLKYIFILVIILILIMSIIMWKK